MVTFWQVMVFTSESQAKIGGREKSGMADRNGSLLMRRTGKNGIGLFSRLNRKHLTESDVMGKLKDEAVCSHTAKIIRLRISVLL